METATAAKQHSTARKGVYEIITDRIIDSLTKSTVPWRISWTKAGVPTNLFSGWQYRGINHMLLSSLGYERNLFISSKQLKELGGYIRPEERSHLVVHWNKIENDLATGLAHVNEKRKGSFLNYSTVYNIEQCANIPEDRIPQYAAGPDPIAACERIITGMPNYPAIRHKEFTTHYNPIDDFINIPKQNKFDLPEQFYAALFHQLAHSTGHRSRLDRMGLIQMVEIGYGALSLEEMVAEIVTCYLTSLAGIQIDYGKQQPEWIDWLSALKTDSRIIFTAFQLAQKAIDYILNVQIQPEDMSPSETQ